MAINVKIKLLNERAKMPVKAHDDDFCYDLVATSCEEIAPHVFKYGLGIALQIAEKEHFGIEGLSIRPRSSVWKTGMILSNCIGTIDYGYTGEISAVFYHVMPNMPRYQVGDRICQLHYDYSDPIRFVVAESLDSTERGDGGYGSSGR